ncbi:PREDICTED: centromere-associated protein E isoform X1 [Brassica oleracea var. oleracea]|uniref:centromere-associated protein E isoform X1 n=1 Tax=Brassica oleracea var. oleracea TaxID=109376 RepID=UPI0006A6B457|nr:PREDICTED: centromere-associated protein E isoform X1 [Brassica oleracea var. oleracea]
MSAPRSQRSSTISPSRPLRSPASAPTKRPVTPSSPAASSTSHLRSSPSPSTSSGTAAAATKLKENITVTIRFRPLSPREVNNGDEIAWYADGDYTIRNEYNPDLCYAFDRVFGPPTTTRRVYDTAAQQVVSGAMSGINGTVFAYGVTSSGKTHTMHGEQRSPGIIPLAVKDVFSIIQETPEREFLLRVSYLEIYNEVINDLLDPTGQNLRIREDSQGTYVEGIKDEVVLSPAHALSLIASGEEHRHVGSNNVNLFSSRSHTMFTLTIESSPHGKGDDGEDVTLSQLHLIDLAGSESSKSEMTGQRRKEGSSINKSLLTLGTVISKLTDSKAAHIPYRDSKLTRLLQSTLSGHGLVSLICTITPASSTSEETHNTLKFAQRCKHVEIKASRNKIMDEKSLIKKYQKEISCLQEELTQLKHGVSMSTSNQEDLADRKLQLKSVQVKPQLRLEEEDEAKAALMGRIQRLTKLILVSTKSSLQGKASVKPDHIWRHTFGEEELAYLPDRRRENMADDNARSTVSEHSREPRDGGTSGLDEMTKDRKKNKTRGGMLGWLKLKKSDGVAGTLLTDGNQNSTNGSASSSSKCAQTKSTRRDKAATNKSFPERTVAEDLFSAAVGSGDPSLIATTIADQMDLLHEQTKILVGEVALRTSSLKRLSEQAARNPEDFHIRDQMQKLEDEISEKKNQIRALEQQMIESFGMSHTTDSLGMSQVLSKLTTQLNEKIFEHEIKSADNRILQEQLEITKSEKAEMQETIMLLRQQLDSLAERQSTCTQQQNAADESAGRNTHSRNGDELSEIYSGAGTPTSVMSLNRVFAQEETKDIKNGTTLNSQALEIENLKKENMRLIEEKDELGKLNNKLTEEASYAKELASAAAVELQNLAEEVTRLCNENAKLSK